MRPFSLDIFEDQLYWVAKEKGEVWRQNKFGRGNKAKVLVVNPWLTQVRVFHQLRYNQSGNTVLGCNELDIQSWKDDCSIVHAGGADGRVGMRGHVKHFECRKRTL